MCDYCDLKAWWTKIKTWLKTCLGGLAVSPIPRRSRLLAATNYIQMYKLAVCVQSNAYLRKSGVHYPWWTLDKMYYFYLWLFLKCFAVAMIGDWNVITMIPFDIPSLQVSLGHQRHLDFPVKRKQPSLCNLVPRAHVSFGQRQDTRLFEPYGACSLLVITWMHQLETLLSVLHENQWEEPLFQGSPELFSPPVKKRALGSRL